MITRIVRIGKSQAIRIPKRPIEQTGLHGDVEVSVQGKSLVIRPASKPRDGWAMAFQDMAKRRDDALIDCGVPSLTAWDEEEWEWR